MAAKRASLNGVYFVALTLLGMECAYRVVYYWFGTLAISVPEAQAAWSHLHVWLPIGLVVLVLWLLVAWRGYNETTTPVKKDKNNLISSR